MPLAQLKDRSVQLAERRTGRPLQSPDDDARPWLPAADVQLPSPAFAASWFAVHSSVAAGSSVGSAVLSSGSEWRVLTALLLSRCSDQCTFP